MSNEAREAAIKAMEALFARYVPLGQMPSHAVLFDAAIAAIEAAKPAGEVVATIDEVVAGTQPYENSLSVDDLRREVRMLWDENAAFRKAILTAPEVPEVAVLWHLEGAAMNYHGADLFDIGKRLQRAHPRTIPYKAELEHAAGLWSILREGLVSRLMPQASVDSAVLAASPVPSEPVFEPGTIRVCPERDGRCPHGLNCPYTLDRGHCDIDASRAALTRPEPAQDAGVKL